MNELRRGATAANATLLLDEYLLTVKRSGTKEHTLRQYRGKLMAYLMDFPGTAWTRVPTEGMERWLDGRDLKASSRRHWRRLLVHFYAWAEREGFVRHSKAEDLTRVRKSPWQPKALRKDQAATLLATYDTAGTNETKAVALMLLAGLRSCEVASLTWADVDFSGRTIHVTGKGDRERTVAMRGDLARRLGTAGSDEEYVVAGRQTSQRVQYTVQVAMDRALPGNTKAPHSLRHTFGTFMYVATRDIVRVQKLLGHASIATTEVYIGLAADAAHEDVELLDYAA